MLETIFKSLADENRLRIINLLLNGTFCVCEMEVMLDISQSNLSRHLSKLKSAALISSKKDAQWVKYHLSDAFKRDHSHLFSYLNEKLSVEEYFKLDLKRLNNYRQNKLCCNLISQDRDRVIEIVNR